MLCEQIQELRRGRGTMRWFVVSAYAEKQPEGKVASVRAQLYESKCTTDLLPNPLPLKDGFQP